ncbi:MAG: class E sortase [Candidatus Saccharibacteria bacterium]
MLSTNESHHNHQSQEAAAKVIRSQIDNIYAHQNTNDDDIKTKVEVSQPQLRADSPYQKTHSESTATQTNDWKQYHTAWQNYYQKYYEGYYKHHLAKAAQVNNDHDNEYFSNNPELPKTASVEDLESDLKQQLIDKVQQSAHKIRKSRHFLPIIAGISVVILFLFLQYNRVLVSNVVAYVSPGNIDPQNIVIDPNADIVVSPEPRLIIPKINVDVPVLYGVGSDYNSQMAAMAKGVAQFAIPGADSHPGQVGNTVIAGHSSNDLFDSGSYKFIFAQLDKLNAGDTIYANYNSKRYTYVVTGKEVVKPTDVSKLVYPTTKPILTLLTCTPLGTSINRLLVIAEQVSPDPSAATAASDVATVSKSTSMPGNSLTFLEKLFGIKN